MEGYVAVEPTAASLPKWLLPGGRRADSHRTANIVPAHRGALQTHRILMRAARQVRGTGRSFPLALRPVEAAGRCALPRNPKSTSAWVLRMSWRAELEFRGSAGHEIPPYLRVTAASRRCCHIRALARTNTAPTPTPCRTGKHGERGAPADRRQRQVLLVARADPRLAAADFESSRS